jgi:hypothetical protein
MPEEVRVVLNEAAVHVLCSPDNPAIAAIMDEIAGILVQGQKRRAPVSKVVPYASPAGGRRFAGDFPQRPPGYLRSSIHAFRVQGGDILIGPTASYGEWVNDGTPAHEIVSHGRWPLRNRATGQVFGRVVHHPGTRAVRFVESSLEDVRGAVFHIG